MAERKNITRIAAVGDIHVTENDKGKWSKYFCTIAERADVLLLCGDLTDTGRPEEASVLIEELNTCEVPVVAVLGNHDFESGNEKAVAEILSEKIHLLDGNSFVIGNVAIAGVKGFGGGFGRYKMPAYGENLNKVYVQEVINEAEKLDRALYEIEKLDPDLKKIAIIHYAPIEETIVGEPVQIFNFLGSSYLTPPLEKYNVEVAFHGHAHRGSLKGITPKGVPVYNVSVPVLRTSGFKVPFYFMEV